MLSDIAYCIEPKNVLALKQQRPGGGRERIYIVGFLKETQFSWNDFNHPGKTSKTMKDILHTENGDEIPEKDYTTGEKSYVNESISCQ